MTGSTAGDVDYARYGTGYAGRRQTDPRIAARIHAALGPSRTVVNVGAGAGSYEPAGVALVAVEPSPAMIDQRPVGTSPVVRAVADALPFPPGSFDAAMATVTVHQWPDPAAGLAELRRVTTGPVVVLTFDPDALDRPWPAEYAPDLYRAESARYPAMDAIVSALGGEVTVDTVPVPFDCRDGFTEAFFGRPEAFLDPAVRRSQSAWSFVDPEVAVGYADRLRADLASGAWDARYGALRHQESFDGSLRLVVAR